VLGWGCVAGAFEEVVVIAVLALCTPEPDGSLKAGGRCAAMLGRDGAGVLKNAPGRGRCGVAMTARCAGVGQTGMRKGLKWLFGR
jgi:hypothetical protein